MGACSVFPVWDFFNTLVSQNVFYMMISNDEGFLYRPKCYGESSSARSSASYFYIVRYFIRTHPDVWVMPWRAQGSKGPAISSAHETTYGDV